MSVEESCGNVFQDLGLRHPDLMLAMSNLKNLREQVKKAECSVTYQLGRVLGKIIDEDYDFEKWINTRIEAFDATPLSLIEKCDFDSLIEMIYRLESGEGF